MGTHALGRLHSYSIFKCIMHVTLYKGHFQQKNVTLHKHFLEIDKRHDKCKHTKKALFSPRAAQAAENGYAAAASWTTTPAPASGHRQSTHKGILQLEEVIERVIYNCRFITLLAVVGSLGGSVICFIQGCRFVNESFFEYIHGSLHGKDTGHVIHLLVASIDVFLVATVMLIFGMGVYELFVNMIGLPRKDDDAPLITPRKSYTGSNLFGLFRLRERPSWLEIRSLHELKTKVGHVIVMILLVGMFEKSKVVAISTGFDLLCFSGSILMSAGCLFLLSKLQAPK